MNENTARVDILGTGWHFPIGVDKRGGMALSRHERDIEESMKIILATAKGERRMRPEFGCRIHELVFAPAGTATIGLVRQYVEEALGWWEPRIEVLDVDAHPDDRDTSRLVIDIKYRPKATNDERSLVYPFYLSP